MARTLLIALGTLCVATACAPGEATVADGRPSVRSPAPSILRTPVATREPAREPRLGPIALSDLPEQGFAVQSALGIVFVDVDGDVVDRVRGLWIHGNPGNVGVWFKRNGTFFRLDRAHDRVRPVSRRFARAEGYEEGPDPNLSPPRGTFYNGMRVGRWRYALYRGDGVVLGQWSGECEVPTAYWVDNAGAHIVTGQDDLADAPESLALGWGADGRAYVYLGEGLCGGRGDPPGIYGFTGVGEGGLVYRTPRNGRVDMWGGPR